MTSSPKSGFGTYNGLTFVFLKSKPTIEVPFGTIAPPLTELNLYNTLFTLFKSNIEPLSNSISVVPVTSDLFTSKYCALPPLFFTYKPGLLSITCSPG